MIKIDTLTTRFNLLRPSAPAPSPIQEIFQQSLSQNPLVNEALQSKHEKTVFDITLKTTNEADQEKLIEHCWKNNFLHPLQLLCNRMNKTKTIEIIRSLIRNETNLSDKQKLVIPLLPQLGVEALRDVISWIVQSPNGNDLFIKEIIENLAIGEMFREIEHTLPLDYYIFFFQFLFRNDEPLTAELCDQIFAKDKSWISTFFQKLLFEETDPLKIFTASTAILLPYLNLETLEQVNHKLDQTIVGKTPKQMFKLAPFMLGASKVHLLGWKYHYDPEVRDYTQISIATQFDKDGPIDQEKAETIIQTLNDKAPSSVRFDTNFLFDDLSGGTCSAMTLRLLKEYREERQRSRSALEALQRVGPKIATSSPDFRTIQAAYNTITKKGNPLDFKKDKIEALLHYENPDLTIISHSPDLDLFHTTTNDALEKQYQGMDDGIYVVRLIHPHNVNAPHTHKVKEEAFGHTTLCIKEAGQFFYFDPSIGVLQLNKPSQLSLVIQWQNERWNLSTARFYKVEQKA